eukprot:286106-Chlamydomonas_euryale.AAC.3
MLSSTCPNSVGLSSVPAWRRDESKRTHGNGHSAVQERQPPLLHENSRLQSCPSQATPDRVHAALTARRNPPSLCRLTTAAACPRPGGPAGAPSPLLGQDGTRVEALEGCLLRPELPQG